MDWPRILELTLHDLEASFTIQCLCINLLEDRIVELEGPYARTAGPVANKRACRKNHRHRLPPPERATTPLAPSFPSLGHIYSCPTPSPVSHPILRSTYQGAHHCTRSGDGCPSDTHHQSSYSSNKAGQTSRHLSQRPPTEKAY